jgi:hypothetical protein
MATIAGAVNLRKVYMLGKVSMRDVNLKVEELEA